MFDPKSHFNYIKEFTKVFIENANEHRAVREGRCLNVQYPFMLLNIQEGDLFVGRFAYPVIYFMPQTYSNKGGYGFGYIWDRASFETLMQSSELSPEEKDELIHLKLFWATESTAPKLREAYPLEMAKAFPSDEWTEDSGIAFPLYRIAGSQLDYDKLLQFGIQGMKSLVLTKLEKSISDSGKQGLYKGMLLALEAITITCLHFASMAAYLYKETTNKQWASDLQQLETALKNIALGKPANLREAMQLMFIYSSMAGNLNYGRIDEYLGDFLANDLNNGTLSETEAQRLFVGLWKLMIARNQVTDGRPIIGGKGRRNELNANKAALMAMEATRITHDVLPQLSLRFYNGQDEALMNKALDVIAEGNTFPMLYNDDVNIPAVAQAFEVPMAEAQHYTPYGCGEYILYHRSFGTPSGVINHLKSLEITLNNGIDPVTGKLNGLALGQSGSFKTFDELWDAYARQTEYYVHHLAMQEDLEYKVANQHGSFLYLSMLYDDCIERGLALLDGGIRYLGGTLETYGNINVADSLTAINELVYKQKVFSLDKLVNILKANFEGFEKERQLLLNAPKFGNDNPTADEMAQRVHNHICMVTRSQRLFTNLHNYMVVVINNSANTILARKTHASADGRYAFTPMANAINPQGGMDKQGITAMLNSFVKLPVNIHAGSVQNLKLSREIFAKFKNKFEFLLKSYFQNGGAQVMITVLCKNDLENALKEPEKYSNIMVRVGGFSARFVELDADVQQEILSRTMY